jgi:hypothetical protein
MVRRIITAAAAAVLVVATVSAASSRVRHYRHGFGHAHYGWSSGSYRGNPTNTNGF